MDRGPEPLALPKALWVVSPSLVWLVIYIWYFHVLPVGSLTIVPAVWIGSVGPIVAIIPFGFLLMWVVDTGPAIRPIAVGLPYAFFKAAYVFLGEAQMMPIFLLTVVSAPVIGVAISKIARRSRGSNRMDR
jgi:hypothetical protein